MTKWVQTVLGRIPTDELGVTLSHEHLWFDVRDLYLRAHEDLRLSDEKITLENRGRVMRDLHSIVFEYGDNLFFRDADLMVKELQPFIDLGGKTVIDVTSVDIHRNPLKLREIARRTGLNIVMGGSYYYFRSLDAPLREDILAPGGVHRLADRMIRDVLEGADGTDVRAGVIGEVGNLECEGDRAIMRASAIAQRETGVPVILHMAQLESLDIAEREGADLTKFVMGHWSMREPVAEAVARGAYVAFDQFGMNFPGIIPDTQRVDDVLEMIRLGYEKRLLLSMDTCWKVRLAAYGGQGFADLFRNAIPMMLERGVDEKTVRAMLTDNVRALFEG